MTLSVQAATTKDQRTARYGVELQHRHFSFIAAVIANIGNRTTRVQMANRFADACAASNPRFDRARFLTACKLDR